MILSSIHPSGKICVCGDKLSFFIWTSAWKDVVGERWEIIGFV